MISCTSQATELSLVELSGEKTLEMGLYTQEVY